MLRYLCFFGVCVACAGFSPFDAGQGADNELALINDVESKKILFVAGRPSHGYGSHEHYAGCRLLAKCLQAAHPQINVDVIKHRWPEPDDLEGVDAIVMYSDGGNNHPVMQHLDQVNELADAGVGIVCIHYAVEVPKGPAGRHFVNWIGGYFETNWSVNPHWKAEFKAFPDHPIANGLQPFAIQDEWYYHMRFRENMDGVTPILTAIPPESTLSRPDGPHSGNPHVRAKAGQPQHVAWAVQRDDGGRGFGFTGGHFHWNWGNPNFRRVVLNAIVWSAGMEVPEGGVDVGEMELQSLKQNQDFDPPESFDFEKTIEKFGLKGSK